MFHTTYQSADTVLGVECALPEGFRPAGSSPMPPREKIRWSREEREDVQRAAWARLSGIFAAVLLALGVWYLGQGLYIQAKAQFAQYLIADAWNRTLAGEQSVKPWPWADTWPVAKLTARLGVPDRKLELYVLEGANGRAIAFGPGHLQGTPLPGEAGNSVIAGHRDTHLAFMRDLRAGDELQVQRRDGALMRYQVNAMEVLDKRDTWVTKNEGPGRLTLVTCWPFDALRAGGPGRYVVFANAL